MNCFSLGSKFRVLLQLLCLISKEPRKISKIPDTVLFSDVPWWPRCKFEAESDKLEGGLTRSANSVTLRKMIETLHIHVQIVNYQSISLFCNYLAFFMPNCSLASQKMSAQERFSQKVPRTCSVTLTDVDIHWSSKICSAKVVQSFISSVCSFLLNSTLLIIKFNRYKSLHDKPRRLRQL